MDDQARRLRQLIHDARHASVVLAGPPLLSVVAAGAAIDVTQFVDVLRATAEARGVRVALEVDSESPTDVDWRLAIAGPGYASDDAELWRGATTVLLVTTAVDESMLAAYTALKVAERETPLPAIEVVVSESDATLARHSYNRLDDTCRKFLSCALAGFTWFDGEDASVGQLVDRLLLVAPVDAGTPLALNTPALL